MIAGTGLVLIMFTCHGRAHVLRMTWSVTRKSATAEAARQSRAVTPPSVDTLAFTRRPPLFASFHAQFTWRISPVLAMANDSGGANYTSVSQEEKRAEGPQAEEKDYKAGDMVKVRATVTGGKRCRCLLIQGGAMTLQACQIKRGQNQRIQCAIFARNDPLFAFHVWRCS